MRRPLIVAGLALACAASLLGTATAQAAETTELTLEQRSEAVSYGDTLELVAKLTVAGKPLGARSVSLHSGADVLSVGTTSSRGEATFKLKATANRTYEARFGATAPADLTAYLPSVSKPLAVVAGSDRDARALEPASGGPKGRGRPRRERSCAGPRDAIRRRRTRHRSR